MSPPKMNVAAVLEQFRKMRAGGAAVGAAIKAIAGDFDATESAIRYHLKAANLIGESAGQPAPAVAEGPDSDAALGIGQDDDAPAADDPLAALMANPQFAALLDKAVSARLAQMGSPAVPVAGGGDFGAFLQKMERMIEAQTIQQPGYIKPLTPDQLMDRAQGEVEMRALIEKFRAKETPPLYLLGLQFYAGDQLYEAGQEIRTFLPPAESFQPMNDPAVQVYTAFLRSIGGATPGIGDQLAAAMVAAKAQPLVTGMPGAAPAARGPVEVVQGRAPVQVGPKRILGSMVPEQHTTSVTPQPAGTPRGPAFV